MSLIDRAIAGLSPAWALKRARANAALSIMMNYNAATTGNRGGSWRRSASDADAAAGHRARLAFVARDMVRNTPFALRAQAVIANNVASDGIIWKVSGGPKTRAEALRKALKAHFDTTSIDANGRCNLYGLQRLVVNTIVDSGEVLIRRRRRFAKDGLVLPFQIEVLEPDFLDTSRDSLLASRSTSDNEVREGIEYDAIGRRVAYWLFDRHPGGVLNLRSGLASRRVPASEILHVYRQDRPGQMRGVTWFAPIAMAMQDLDDMQDAQLMRQKIAACFAAFRVSPDGDFEPTNNSTSGETADIAGLSNIMPGRIQNLAQGEDIRFSSPPAVDGYDKFTRLVLQSAAAGMGITYEALSGDLSGVNFSSARMGRMEMDRNVSAWQWLMMIPQMMQPLAAWAIEAFEVSTGQRRGSDLTLDWVPPHRMLVDPAREIPALRDKVKAGFASRQGVLRELGYDPEDIMAEQAEDRALCVETGLRFDSDVHFDAGAAPAAPIDPLPEDGLGTGEKQTDKGGDNVQE